jgi:hypothetical protein
MESIPFLPRVVGRQLTDLAWWWVFVPNAHFMAGAKIG